MIYIKKHLYNIILSISLAFFLGSFHPAHSQENLDWVSESDAFTAKLLEVIARHSPESAGRIGVDGYDEEIGDLSSGYRERELQDMGLWRSLLWRIWRESGKRIRTGCLPLKMKLNEVCQVLIN